jgi:hypothetical protein
VLAIGDIRVQRFDRFAAQVIIHSLSPFRALNFYWALVSGKCFGFKSRNCATENPPLALLATPFY